MCKPALLMFFSLWFLCLFFIVYLHTRNMFWNLRLSAVQITRNVDKTNIFQACFGRRCAGAVDVSRGYGE